MPKDPNLKRVRKNDAKGSKFKAEAQDNQQSSREERLGAPAEFDILTYVRSLNDGFKNTREKYSLFYESINDFIHDKYTNLIVGLISVWYIGISVEEVLGQVGFLFKGREELLVDLKIILSFYYELKSTLDKKHRAKCTHREALDYMRKIKVHYGSQSTKYETFLRIFKSFSETKIDALELFCQVFTLFGDSAELFEGFKTFCPLKWEIKDISIKDALAYTLRISRDLRWERG